MIEKGKKKSVWIQSLWTTNEYSYAVPCWSREISGGG